MAHQHGNNQCPFNDNTDALAKQAAATHPLQLRPCVLRRAGESLAPSGSRNVQQKGNAEGVSGHQSVLAPQQPKGTAKTERVFGPLGIPQFQIQKKYTANASSHQHRYRDKLSRCIRVMVGKGTRNRQVGCCPAATQTDKYVFTTIKPMVTVLMWDLQQETLSVHHRRPVSSLNCVAFNCVLPFPPNSYF